MKIRVRSPLIQQKQDIYENLMEFISNNKVVQIGTNTADERKWVSNMSLRKLTYIEIDLFAKGPNFSITSKLLIKNALW